MDMTKEFIKTIQESAAPNVVEHLGRRYVDKQMAQLPCGPVVKQALSTGTLSSVVDYITRYTDNRYLQEGRHIVHVSGPKEVSIYKELDLDKRRDCLVKAEAYVSEFPYGRFLDVESFIINLQSGFVQDESTAALLAFIASVKTDTGVEQCDDGISQKVMARSGVALVNSVKVPNPITLRPYRTFSEVEQPASPFVFRVKSDERSGVSMALFEADGSAWKHEAITSIREYFKKALEGEKESVIILA